MELGKVGARELTRAVLCVITVVVARVVVVDTERWEANAIFRTCRFWGLLAANEKAALLSFARFFPALSFFLIVSSISSLFPFYSRSFLSSPTPNPLLSHA